MKEFIIPVVVLIIVIVGLVSFGNGQKRAGCDRFEQESGYETKYIEYTFWYTDCLAKLDSGKWVSAFNLRGGEIND